MYVHMYMCMYAHMCIYVHAYVYMCMYARMYGCLCGHVFVSHTTRNGVNGVGLKEGENREGKRREEHPEGGEAWGREHEIVRWGLV